MTESDRLLTGKVALVTGAASGMGAEMALALLAEGASVAALDVADHGLASLGG